MSVPTCDDTVPPLFSSIDALLTTPFKAVKAPKSAITTPEEAPEVSNTVEPLSAFRLHPQVELVCCLNASPTKIDDVVVNGGTGSISINFARLAETG